MNGRGQHVGVGLIGVVVTLLESIRENTGGLGLGEAESSLNSRPFVSFVQVLEVEVVSRSQKRTIGIGVSSKVQILVEKLDSLLVGESSVTSTLCNLRLGNEVHAE